MKSTRNVHQKKRKNSSYGSWPVWKRCPKVPISRASLAPYHASLKLPICVLRPAPMRQQLLSYIRLVHPGRASTHLGRPLANFMRPLATSMRP